MTHLSIIIPAYNEEKRIGKTLSGIWDYMVDKRYGYEVIVVDDGSTDGTVSEAEKSRLAIENKIRVIKNGVNRGKGFSVKNGISNSRGEYILFSDADLSTPIKELDKLFSIMAGGYDAVIGSRALKGSDVRIHQPWYREIMGKIFNLFIKILLFREFNDTQCGFKLFKGDMVREIAREMRIDGFAFDVEMLYLAKIKRYKVREEGVAWENSADSKVKLFRSPVNMFLDIFKIRKIHPCVKK